MRRPNVRPVDPCPGCRLHLERCICRFIPALDLKTKLTLVAHNRELKRTTSTGHLAVKALLNSELHIRGKENAPLDLSSILTDQYETYVLYPSTDAVPIENLLLALYQHKLKATLQGRGTWISPEGKGGPVYTMIVWLSFAQTVVII